MLRTILACSLLFSLAFPALAETVWVTDRFEITMRSGPSTRNEIRRMLASGAALEVLERDPESGYTRVRTAGGSTQEGWVLSRYLMSDSSARTQLADIARTIAPAAASDTPRSQREVILASFQDASDRIDELTTQRDEVRQRLDELQELAADTVRINADNARLTDQLESLQSRLEVANSNNAELQRADLRQWFLAGAGVLLFGVLLGIWLPRMRRRRDHGYGRY